MRVTAASWRLRNSAPFGSPVVPEVNTRATGRSGSSSSGATGSGRRSASTWSAESSSSAPPAAARTAACSGGARRGFTPAVIGADLGGGRVGDHVGGVGRQAQQHDVAGPDAGGPQPGRHLVGARVEVGVGEPASRRGRRTPAAGRTARPPPGRWRRASPDRAGRCAGRERTPAWPSARASLLMAEVEEGVADVEHLRAGELARRPRASAGSPAPRRRLRGDGGGDPVGGGPQVGGGHDLGRPARSRAARRGADALVVAESVIRSTSPKGMRVQHQRPARTPPACRR